MHAAANDSVAAMDAVRRLILMSPPVEIHVVWGDCRSTKNRANAETGKPCVPIWDIGSLAERDVGRVLGYARCGCRGLGFVSRSRNLLAFRENVKVRQEGAYLIFHRMKNRPAIRAVVCGRCHERPTGMAGLLCRSIAPAAFFGAAAATRYS